MPRVEAPVSLTLGVVDIELTSGQTRESTKMARGFAVWASLDRAADDAYIGKTGSEFQRADFRRLQALGPPLPLPGRAPPDVLSALFTQTPYTGLYIDYRLVYRQTCILTRGP